MWREEGGGVVMGGASIIQSMVTYCLALAMFLSILLPVRKVKPPRINRYFRVLNMFCERRTEW